MDRLEWLAENVPTAYGVIQRWQVILDILAEEFHDEVYGGSSGEACENIARMTADIFLENVDGVPEYELLRDARQPGWLEERRTEQESSRDEELTAGEKRRTEAIRKSIAELRATWPEHVANVVFVYDVHCMRDVIDDWMIAWNDAFEEGPSVVLGPYEAAYTPGLIADTVADPQGQNLILFFDDDITNAELSQRGDSVHALGVKGVIAGWGQLLDSTDPANLLPSCQVSDPRHSAFPE